MGKISTTNTYKNPIGKTAKAEDENRVLCLYRVSTVQQLYRNEKEEADIPMQRVRCRAFAQSMGWSIVYELQEEGVSGHKIRAENRDKIQLIKEYADQRKFDILLVYMFDRIGRIADETPFVVEWLINHGIRVWSAEEGEQRIDNHTDRLLNYIRFWQADGESRKTSLRTANSLHILTEQGLFTGGVCPYGFSFVKLGRMNKRKQEVNDLAVCASEASVIRLMFNLAYYSGYGAQRIANYLYANGYKNRNGDNWHPSTIQGILRNPLYTGILRSGEVYSEPQEHLRIIDDKVFSSVQDMLKKRSRQYESTRTDPLTTKADTLLSGNIFCGHCGARLCVTTSGKGRKRADGTEQKRTRYCCQTKTRKHGSCDGQTGYTAAKVDASIDKILRQIFSRIKGIDQQDIIRQKCANDESTQIEHLKTLKKNLEKACAEQEKLQHEIVRAVMGESAFTPEMLRTAIEAQKNKIDELSQMIDTAKQELSNHEKRIKTLTDSLQSMLEWSDLYDMADPGVKKMVAARIVERVEVRRDYELTITLNLGVQQFIDSIEGCN